jgi:hypothetical protein
MQLQADSPVDANNVQSTPTSLGETLSPEELERLIQTHLIGETVNTTGACDDAAQLGSLYMSLGGPPETARLLQCLEVGIKTRPCPCTLNF